MSVVHFVLTPLVDGAGFAGMGMAEARPALDSSISHARERRGGGLLRLGLCTHRLHKAMELWEEERAAKYLDDLLT